MYLLGSHCIKLFQRVNTQNWMMCVLAQGWLRLTVSTGCNSISVCTQHFKGELHSFTGDCHMHKQIQNHLHLMPTVMKIARKLWNVIKQLVTKLCRNVSVLTHYQCHQMKRSVIHLGVCSRKCASPLIHQSVCVGGMTDTVNVCSPSQSWRRSGKHLRASRLTRNKVAVSS